MNTKALVVKDNRLIEATFSLPLADQRLILLAVVECRKLGITTDHNKRIEIRADDYVNQYKVSKQTAYESLKKACSNLMHQTFWIDDFDEKRQRNIPLQKHWLEHIKYIDNEATVELLFKDEFLPYITELKQRFTSYELFQVSDLTSKYALRLYELLVRWRNTSNRLYNLPIAQLRDALGVESAQYTLMHQFKQRVLDVAVNQINEHTDINVSYEQKKNGKTIVSINFQFDWKSSDSAIDLTLTDKQCRFFAERLAFIRPISELAHVGESPAAFTERLSKLFKDSNFVAEHLELMKAHGFRVKESKSSEQQSLL